MKSSTEIRWLGHSAFSMTLPSGKHLLIDPFLLQNPSTPEEFKKQTHVDAIFLTHGHEDHVGDTLEIAKATGCKVFGMVELIGLLRKHGLSDAAAVGFNKGGTVTFDDVSVTMVHAQHSSSYAGEYAGEAAGLVFKVEKDITFYHMGDTNAFTDLEWIGEFYQPDLVAVPIGDFYTMGPAEAALAVELLNPARVTPIHYGTFPVLTGDPAEFKTLVERDSDAVVVIPKPGELVKV